MLVRPKRLMLTILQGLFLLVLLSPVPALSSTMNLTGTVLFDREVSAYGRLPGFGDTFTGTILVDEQRMEFSNDKISDGGYESFSTFSGGFFEYDGHKYFYALSQGEGHNERMGVLWWADPLTVKAHNRVFENVYGLAFYMKGSSTYTPALMLALNLQGYLESGRLGPVLGNNGELYLNGCLSADNEAFLALIDSPLVFEKSNNARDNVSAVPLPASFWLMACGLLVCLVRVRRRARSGRG